MSHPPIRLPRWLGTPSPKTPARSKDGDPEDKPAFLVYEWDEHSFAPKPQETRQRAADVMRRLPERGVVLILGVPGQGKTTLLKEWQDTLERPALLGECRSVNKLGEGENILEVMFKKGVNSIQRIQNWQAEQRLVVLVDALDELSANEDWENALADAIRSAAESQTVVISCRTHVWQDRLERLFRERKVVIQQTYTLLGFTPAEQLEYLKQWASQNGHTQQAAETLAKNLSKHPQLRSLAANALLLELIAPVALAEKLELPASRAEFYSKAIDYMWKQKRETRDHAALIPLRDQFLRALALKTLDTEKGRLKVELSRGLVQEALSETTQDEAKQNKLLELLQKIGLLVEANPNTSELRFVHLTFQEYALAQGLILGVSGEEKDVSERLEQALVKYWDKQGLEATLALAISIVQKLRVDLIDPIRGMLDSWNGHGISAIEKAIHLCVGSAIDNLELIRFLWKRLPRHSVVRFRFAHDEQMPNYILQQVSHYRHLMVESQLASNPSSPIDILLKLLSNSHVGILRSLAGNPSSPPSALEKLASVEDSIIQRNLAGNSNTPIKILRRLLVSNDRSIVENLLGNSNLPMYILDTFAKNTELHFQRMLAGINYIPQSLLLTFASSEDKKIRRGLAGNFNTPPEILEKLASSEDAKLLQKLAGNPSTPVDTLVRLSCSNDKVTLQRLASNPAIPDELINALMKQQAGTVLRRLASNPWASGEVLEKLSQRKDSRVSHALAQNPNTPTQILELLASKKDKLVLRRLAANPSTPEAILQRLSLEKDLDVTAQLAANPSTPTSILRKLTSHTKLRVILKLAENPKFVLEWLLPPPKEITIKEKTVKPWIPALEAEVNVVLFLPSDPSDQDRLKLLRELGKIKRQVGAAKHKDKFDLQIEALTESINISEALQTINPSILHFAGHGSQYGELVVLDEAGNSEFMPLESLVTMIRTVKASRLRCVIRNACYTKKKAKKLLEQVRYVIAYRKKFDDKHAIAFAEGFYQALAKFEHDIKTAFEMGQAQIPDLEAQKNLVLLER